MAFKGLRFAGFEWKNLSASKIRWVAIGAIAIIPLLYGALYLSAFEDPYERLNEVPVAVVNEDAGASIDGTDKVVGNEVVDKLKDEKSGLGWHFVDAKEAQQGLEDGKYFMTCTIPSSFSSDIASVQGNEPHNAQLIVNYNEAENLLASQIGATVWDKVRVAVSDSVGHEYWNTVLAKIGDSAKDLNRAADGARQLSEGLTAGHEGSATITKNLGVLNQGANKLQAGLTKLNGGAQLLASSSVRLADGASQLLSGSERLAIGADTLAAGLAQLQGQGSGPLAAGLAELAQATAALPENADAFDAAKKQIDDGFGVAVAGADALRARVDNELNPALDSATAGASQLSQGLAGLKSGYADLSQGLTQVQQTLTAANQLAATDPAQAQALYAQAQAGLTQITTKAIPIGEGINRLSSGAGQLDEGLTKIKTGSAALSGGLGQLQGGLGQLQGGFNQFSGQISPLVHNAGALKGGIAKASAGASLLNAKLGDANQGAAALSNGAKTLRGGLGVAQDGANKLSGGAAQLADGTNQALDGARQIAQGSQKLEAGSSTLTQGLARGKQGAAELEQGLSDGAKQAAESASNPQAKAEVMKDPVQLKDEYYTHVKNYGTGFAPYFMALGLWVGATVAGFIFKPLNRRLIINGGKPFIAAMANYLPMAVLSIVQASLLMAVLQFGLQLQIDNVAAFWGLGYLTALVFAAILQLLGALLGLPGKFVAIILLMLQLTACAGTFPIETTPAFFQAINPYMPMTYVVSAMRQIMTGMDYGVVAFDVFVLVCIGLASYLLTVWTAARKRMVRMEDIHPILEAD